MTDFSPEAMRKRFAELTKIYDAADAKLAPLQQELTDFVATYADKERAIRTKIAKIKDDTDLYNVEMERALISRALGGKTSAPEETPNG